MERLLSGSSSSSSLALNDIPIDEDEGDFDDDDDEFEEEVCKTWFLLYVPLRCLVLVVHSRFRSAISTFAGLTCSIEIQLLSCARLPRIGLPRRKCPWLFACSTQFNLLPNDFSKTWHFAYPSSWSSIQNSIFPNLGLFATGGGTRRAGEHVFQRLWTARIQLPQLDGVRVSLDSCSYACKHTNRLQSTHVDVTAATVLHILNWMQLSVCRRRLQHSSRTKLCRYLTAHHLQSFFPSTFFIY